MKTNKILLVILLLITVCQTRDILDPEIRKIQFDRQKLDEVAARFGKCLTAFEKERMSKTILHFRREDDACKSICLNFKLPLTCLNIVTSFSPLRFNQNLKIMIVLNSDRSSHKRYAHFINENHIKPEDILAITKVSGYFTIFFYADDAFEEITHGLFS